MLDSLHLGRTRLEQLINCVIDFLLVDAVLAHLEEFLGSRPLHSCREFAVYLGADLGKLTGEHGVQL